MSKFTFSTGTIYISFIRNIPQQTCDERYQILYCNVFPIIMLTCNGLMVWAYRIVFHLWLYYNEKCGKSHRTQIFQDTSIFKFVCKSNLFAPVKKLLIICFMGIKKERCYFLCFGNLFALVSGETYMLS